MLQCRSYNTSLAFVGSRTPQTCTGGTLSRKKLVTRNLSQQTFSQKGFGKATGRQTKNRPKLPFKEGDDDWISVASLSTFRGKQVKAIELRDKSFVVLYKVDGQTYCSDANSTAYKFPLANAKIIQRSGGPAVEVPLDGTVYDLDTGKVLEWCPRNNLLRTVLGTLKSNQEPEDLKVYPTHVDASGKIYVKFNI